MTNVTPANQEKKAKPNYKYLRDKDREMVKGIFHFYEVPGGEMSFSYKCWKEDPVERYNLTDGQVYTLPLGVAKHLNKNCWYPEYEFIRGEDVRSTMKIGKKVRRCSFQSLEFVDIDDLTPAGAPMIEEVTFVK